MSKFTYNGQTITASSKQEAIQKIITGSFKDRFKGSLLEKKLKEDSLKYFDGKAYIDINTNYGGAFHTLTILDSNKTWNLIKKYKIPEHIYLDKQLAENDYSVGHIDLIRKALGQIGHKDKDYPIDINKDLWAQFIKIPAFVKELQKAKKHIDNFYEEYLTQKFSNNDLASIVKDAIKGLKRKHKFYLRGKYAELVIYRTDDRDYRPLFVVSISQEGDKYSYKITRLDDKRYRKDKNISKYVPCSGTELKNKLNTLIESEIKKFENSPNFIEP